MSPSHVVNINAYFIHFLLSLLKKTGNFKCAEHNVPRNRKKKCYVMLMETKHFSDANSIFLILQPKLSHCCNLSSLS